MPKTQIFLNVIDTLIVKKGPLDFVILLRSKRLSGKFRNLETIYVCQFVRVGVVMMIL